MAQKTISANLRWLKGRYVIPLLRIVNKEHEDLPEPQAHTPLPPMDA